MTAKEQFLQKILLEIQKLQRAYDLNKDLPDYMFESTPVIISKPIDRVSANVAPLNGPPGSQIAKYLDKVRVEMADYELQKKLGKSVDTTQYGATKKLLLDILRERGKSMQKIEISEEFAERSGKTVAELANSITNGLAGLKEEGLVRGYKPAGLKFKGLFWALSEWFEGDKIKLEHEPYSGKLKSL